MDGWNGNQRSYIGRLKSSSVLKTKVHKKLATIVLCIMHEMLILLNDSKLDSQML